MTPFFAAWPLLAERIGKADRLLLMLDVDGTLAPIAPRPEDARIPAATQAALAELARCPRVAPAFVSGRAVADVRRLVGIDRAHYFGSHGRQRTRPGSGRVEVDMRCAAAVAEVCARLSAALKDTPGAAVENKQVSAAAHYRNVPPRLRGRAAEIVRGVLADRPDLRLSAGKMVFDITPRDGIDKGAAATRLLAEEGGMAFYFGDDTTDESAFAALPGDAVTVFVGPPGADSAARYRMDDPAAVGRALRLILDACKGRKGEGESSAASLLS